jgi:Cof subfamily protein (haloacid dehalogenase superfamily)
VRPRLLALDIDGTLLDPYGDLTDSVREAVGAAVRRGLRVTLCTGRRFRTALPVARDLGLSGSVVVHNGVLVKDIESLSTEFANVLPRALVAELLLLLRDTHPPLLYVDAFAEDTDIFTEGRERAHAFQLEYLDDNLGFTRVLPDLARRANDDVILMSAMGPEDALAPLRERARERFGPGLVTHLLINKVYRGHILEFLAPGGGKWPALARVAAAAGIPPEAVAVVGDDENDVDMIREAGFGIAMGNAVPRALEHADAVVRSNAEGGAAEAIERVLQRT